MARAAFVVGACLVFAGCPGDAAQSARELTDRATALSAAQRPAEAAAAWRKVIAVADGFEPRLALAEELRALGRQVDSEDELRIALTHAPVPVKSWYELGQHAGGASHDARAAARYFRQSVELDERGADGHYALGLALLQLADYEGASAEIQAALSLAPVDVSWRTAAEDALVVAHLRARERENAKSPR